MSKLSLLTYSILFAIIAIVICAAMQFFTFHF